jgi:hypothetical protein
MTVSPECGTRCGLASVLWSDHSPIVVRVQFQVSDDCLQNVELGAVWLVSCVRSLTYSSEGSVPGFG